MTIRFILHTERGDIGSFEHILASHGITPSIVRTPCCDVNEVDPLADDVLVLMGGPMGVYDANVYPFLSAEIAIVRARLAAGKPVLGICLGAQIIAAALGARVYKGTQGREIGWSPINVSPAGLQTPVRHLDAQVTNMLHWHGDTFDLPEGATLLASSPLYRNQAYSWGANVLGLQCHPEATEEKVERWSEHDVEGMASIGKTAADMRPDTNAFCPRLRSQSQQFLTEWLMAVAPQLFQKQLEAA